MKPATESELPPAPGRRPNPSSSVVLGVVGALALASALAWWFRPNQPLREGPVLTVKWTEGSNHGQFLTRGPNSITVPGGNGGGNMNVNMIGRLYPSYLEITFPDQKPPIVQVIPMGQLVSVEFGDGGVIQPGVGATLAH